MSLVERLRYDGKRVVVAGAASGMGEATAALLVELGAEVHALDVDTARHGARFVRVDLTDPDSIDTAVEGVGAPVHALFVTAGLGGGHPALDILLVNFCGTRQLVERVVPLMPEGSAVAITTSGPAGRTWQEHVEDLRPLLETPSFAAAREWVENNAEKFGTAVFNAGTAAYMFSKEAIGLYALLKAVELGPRGIRVNTIGPGSTTTPMYAAFVERATPDVVERLKGLDAGIARAEDLAYALAFLNSPAADRVNGTDLVVDSGVTARATASGVSVQLPSQR